MMTSLLLRNGRREYQICLSLKRRRIKRRKNHLTQRIRKKALSKILRLKFKLKL